MVKDVVLVVDDSEICLELARDALESAGYRVVTSQTPLGVSRLLRQSDARCVVVDIAMPALTGDKLVQILRKAGAEKLPVILHSDRPLPELVAIGERCGATKVARKDPDCAALVAAVRRIFSKRPSLA